MASTFKLTWRGKEVTAALQQAASRGCFRAAHIHRNECIRLILRTGKSGRIYGNHQASAPGEPPASDTGRLIQSIRVDQEHNATSATIRCAATHGRLLEFGTHRIKPRPFFRPAFANKRREMIAAIQGELNKAMKQ